MKKTFNFLTLLLITTIVFGQDKLLDILPLKDGKINYNGVISIDSINKNELYSRAKRWYVNSYTSAKDVIQLDDKENGELVGKGFFEIPWQASFMHIYTVKIFQTIRIQVKDKKYRYEINDFRIKYYINNTQIPDENIDMPLEDWNTHRPDNTKKFFITLDERMHVFIADLEKTMRTNYDW